MEVLIEERGPFVLIPPSKIQDWYGAFNEEDPETDFDRACEVEETVGVVAVRGNNVLVFGGFPHTIGKLDATNEEALLFRIVYACDVDKVAEQEVTELPDSVWHDTGVKVELDGDYLVYPATCNAESLAMGEPVLTLRFSKGYYTIQEHVFTPDVETRLIVHRFLPV